MRCFPETNKPTKPDVVISSRISTKKLKMELDIQVQVQGVIPEVEKKEVPVGRRMTGTLREGNKKQRPHWRRRSM